MLKKPKIALIGSGNIGGTLAHIIAQENLADIVLFDSIEGLAQGKALDIAQSISVQGSSINLYGSNCYDDLKNSDVVIITAGLPRKPGMTRDELTETNATAMKSIGKELATHCPQAFVIVVTNPLDAMVYELQRSSGIPHNKVVGMAGILDSARFSYLLAKILKVSTSDIKTLVLGGHGDTMVPLLTHTSVSGTPLLDFIKMGKITHQQLQEIIQKTRVGGAEIVSLLKTGSAFYAPAVSAVTMARSYIKDEKRLLPCSAMLKGEYGIQNIYVGVPVIIGKNGVEDIVELSLSDSEKEEFSRSVNQVQKLVSTL